MASQGFVALNCICSTFQDRLWEAVDKEWMDCLSKESVENLLLMPSGVIQVQCSIISSVEVRLILFWQIFNISELRK